MKKALIVKMAMAFMVAVSASTWAQDEAQSSLSDQAAATPAPAEAVAAEPVPMMEAAPMMTSNCGCAQTMTAAPMMMSAPMQVQPAVANCGGCAATQACGTTCGTQCGTNCGVSTCGTSNCGTQACGTNCSSCGTVGMVSYNEVIPTSAPVVTAAPTYTQPVASDCGCAAAPAATYAPAPAATYVANTNCNTCNTCCDPCQRRGLRGRFARRR